MHIKATENKLEMQRDCRGLPRTGSSQTYTNTECLFQLSFYFLSFISLAGGKPQCLLRTGRRRPYSRAGKV